jgi:hypothetical protein
MNKLHIKQYFYVFLTSIIIQGCLSAPTDIVMPQWDVDLNVPFATKNYTLNDIIKSQNYISISAAQDSVYLINSDAYSQSVGITDFIKVLTFSDTTAIPVPQGTGATLYMGFPGGVKLKSATFQTGGLIITGHNTYATSAKLQITIPGIYKSDTTKFFDSTLTVPANSSKSFTITLDGYSYLQPYYQAKAYSNLLWIQAGLSGTSGAGVVSFDTRVSNFYFSKLTGYLPTKSLGIHNNNFSLNLGDASKYRDKVSLKTGTLTLKGLYKSSASKPFIVQVKNLQVQGVINKSGATMNLSYNNPLNTFTFDSTGNLNPPAYTESNSNILKFITFLPDVINISAEYIMNPDNSSDFRTATSSDTVIFTTNFSTKSLLAISQTSFSDTLALDISQDVRDQITKGRAVGATVNVQNAIPLTSWVKITLTDEHYNKLFVITKSTTGADSINFTGASVDANGNVTTPGSSLTTIALDSTQIKLLAQSAHFAIVSVTVSTTGANNAPVLVRAKDWIKLNAYGHVTYRIKEGN